MANCLFDFQPKRISCACHSLTFFTIQIQSVPLFFTRKRFSAAQISFFPVSKVQSTICKWRISNLLSENRQCHNGDATFAVCLYRAHNCHCDFFSFSHLHIDNSFARRCIGASETSIRSAVCRICELSTRALAMTETNSVWIMEVSTRRLSLSLFVSI